MMRFPVKRDAFMGTKLSFVIPAQAGIQYEKTATQTGQSFCPAYAGLPEALDSGVRRNDA
jgi:hypothetical protein